MKKWIGFLLLLCTLFNENLYAEEPVIAWNRLRVPLYNDIFIEKIDDNNLHIFLKGVKNSLLSISFGEVADRNNIAKRVGYKIKNCAFEYINDIKFNGLNAFEWQVTCSSNGTKTTLTIPDLNCEISLNGKRNEFDIFKKIIDSITIDD